MSKKPASLTSDLLARKGEAEPSTIDPQERTSLSAGPAAGPGFSAYGNGGRDGEGEGENMRPLPPEPEIIYTAEETGGGGGSTRLIIGAVLALIIIGGIFLVMTGKERGVAPVSPDITAQTPAPVATQVPATPAAPETAPETLTTVPATPGQSGTEAPATAQTPAAPNSALAGLRPSTSVEGTSVEGAPIGGSAPQAAAPAVPPVASVEVPSAPVQAAKPVEEAAPAQKPVVAAKPSSKGAYVVQLFALKDEAAARSSWTKLNKKHGDVLAGHALDIEKADLGSKGTWYRVRAAGFTTKAAAASACAKLKASGQDCMVRKR